MWNGSRTQHVRAGIEAQGYDLEALELAWSEMAPINHLGALVDKELNVVVSTADKVIPTLYQQEFVDAARGTDLQLHVSESALGHYATVGRFCLYGNV